MMVRDLTAPLTITLCGTLAAAVLASCVLGTTAIPLSDLLNALVRQGDARTTMIIWDIRLPRALAAAGVGAALGASGAALQGLLRNPLAEPGILGVSPCASLFATIAIYWGLTDASPWILPIAAITGALVATAFLAVVAPRVGSIVTLILIGIGLSSLVGALMSVMINLAPNPFTLSDMINWTLGSVANRSFLDLGFALPFWLIGFVMLLAARPGLRVLGLGEEAARAAGLNVGLSRTLVVVGAGLATGASVALAGAVGFVGIIAPHLVRPLVGHDPGKTIIPSALLGAGLLVIADIFSRIIPSEQELKLGVLVALIGAPVFILIAARRRGLEAVS